MSIELEKAGLDRFERIVKIAQLRPAYCKDSDTINNLMRIISKTGHRRIPIVSRRKKFVGIITAMDILDAYLRKHNFDEKVSTIMTRNAVVCEDTDTIGYVLQKFKISRKGTLPILHKSKLVGIVTEREMIKPFSKIKFGMSVGELMTKKPIFIRPNITILDTFKTIVNTQYRRLPIVDSKKLTGFITAIDLLIFMNRTDFSSQIYNPIESLMIDDVYTIKKIEDVSEAIKIFEKSDIGGLPVTDENGFLEGIITERNILEEIV